jgi:hypothetical protein
MLAWVKQITLEIIFDFYYITNMKNRIESLLPNNIPRYIRCYDNGGETADRYTVVFTGRYRHKTGGQIWALGMNASPFHPLGIGMTDSYADPIDYPSYSHLGKKVKFQDLPKDCQKLVLQRYKYLWDIE